MHPELREMLLAVSDRARELNSVMADMLRTLATSPEVYTTSMCTKDEIGRVVVQAHFTVVLTVIKACDMPGPHPAGPNPPEARFWWPFAKDLIDRETQMRVISTTGGGGKYHLKG